MAGPGCSSCRPSCSSSAAGHQAVAPLAAEIARRFAKYVQGSPYPVRAGTHGNTAFACVLALDYAPGRARTRCSSETSRRRRSAGTAATATIRLATSLRLDDFLSPALVEALLMKRVLPEAEFADWLKRIPARRPRPARRAADGGRPCRRQAEPPRRPVPVARLVLCAAGLRGARRKASRGGHAARRRRGLRRRALARLVHAACPRRTADPRTARPGSPQRARRALRHLALAARLDRSNAGHFAAAALAAHKAGEADAAVRYCERALELDPALEAVHQLLFGCSCTASASLQAATAHSPVSSARAPTWRSASEHGAIPRPRAARHAGARRRPAAAARATRLPPNVRIFAADRATSSSPQHDVRAALGGLPVDLALIDGMHHFEYALRDFMNLERLCAPQSTILIDDCFPARPADRAARARR